MALRLAAIFAVLFACGGAASLHLPAVAGRLSGAATRATSRPGSDAGGFVTRFALPVDTVAFRIAVAAAGIYDVRLRYCSPGGHKGIGVRVDGVGHDLMLPQTDEAWSTVDAGRVELSAGDHDLTVGGGWGHYDLDAVDLVPATATPSPTVPGVLGDPAATPAARDLMRRLLAGYGRATLAGGYGDAEDRYVLANTGRRPAVYGADLMEFSPSRIRHGASTAGILDDLLRHAAAGQAVTLSWHWNAPAGLVDAPGRPWYRGFMADATTFDLATAMAGDAAVDHELLLRDLDAIAVPLRRLADAGVPVLWRPLHEADGNWFWWGARGPGPFRQLWRLAYDRLVRHHGLHNLIWVYSCSTVCDRRWYPGDDVVDVVGVDAYPTDDRDPLGAAWSALGRMAPSKPLAVTEFGGVPDVGHMHGLGLPWLYFATWSGPLGPAHTGAAEVRRRYGDGRCGDLDAWRDPTVRAHR